VNELSEADRAYLFESSKNHTAKK